MITKKHWAIFCMDVQKAKGRGLSPFIQGKRVIEVDIYNNTITTSLQGETKTKYTYESCEGSTLKSLYHSVSLNHVSLADLKIVHNNQ